MKQISALCIAAAALVGVPCAASAATLIDQTNLAGQTNTPVSLTFTAGASSTTVDFQGYQLPSFINLSNILLTLSGGSSNLLGTSFTYTPAPCGADASQGPVGANGTNNLSFGGVCIGSYDSFAQTIGTTVGASYTLSFGLSNSFSNQPSGLRIFASDAVTGAVPEPATWTMLLLGFAGMGLVLRYQRRKLALA